LPQAAGRIRSSAPAAFTWPSRYRRSPG